MSGLDVAARFELRFGGAPESLWFAPGRANLIGDHTDYSGGFMLPFAIAAGTTVAVRRRVDGALRVASDQVGDEVTMDLGAVRPGAIEGWAAYAAGAAWPLKRDGIELRGADMLIAGDVPLGAGLSSSASLCCAVVPALASTAGVTLSRAAVARLARETEREMAGAPCGVMDQLASVFGRRGQALLIDARSEELRPIPLDPMRDGLALVVLDSGVRHAVGGGPYAERRRSCEEAAHLLGLPDLRDATLADLPVLPASLRARARHVISENLRVLETVEALTSRDWNRVASLMSASHASLRDDYEVSVAEVDAVIARATAAGVLGARITGGGFGGSVIALVPESRVPALLSAGLEPRVVAPSDGARRVDAPGYGRDGGVTGSSSRS